MSKRDEIVELVRQNPKMTRDEMCKKLGVTRKHLSTVFTYLRYSNIYPTDDENGYVKIFTEKEFNEYQRTKKERRIKQRCMSSKPVRAATVQLARAKEARKNLEKTGDRAFDSLLTQQADLKIKVCQARIEYEIDRWMKAHAE